MTGRRSLPRRLAAALALAGSAGAAGLREQRGLPGVSVIDAATLKAIGRIPVGKRPWGIAVH